MTSKRYCKFATMATILFVAFLHFGCSDFMHPVESTPTPSEYEYNYWLLQKTFLFEEELSKLDPQGDSVQALYSIVQKRDRFTRYIAPSQSESANISLNTSIVQGDVGMEYYLDLRIKDSSCTAKIHPLFIYRVYRDSPADAAKVPRYGNIISVNGIDLSLSEKDPTGYSVYVTYDSVLTYNKNISLTIASGSDTLQFELTKTDVYAPTVFVDTLDGIAVITITEFKQTTVDHKQGTFGELKSYLDSTKDETNARVLNLLNNPGGHVSQCVAMADLFVSKGPLSTRSWRAFKGDGSNSRQTKTIMATPGDAGENGKFILLVNGSSASCAEIFTAAVAEGANIPVAGETTYGKGIGQTTWQTIGKGLAIITNLEFLTPKGNSYHGKGIVPEHSCDGKASMQCGVNWAKKIHGTETLLKRKASNTSQIVPIRRGFKNIGGAYIEEN